MINESLMNAMLLVACCGGAVGLLGGSLGLFAFLNWKKRRYFLEFINRKLSKRSYEDED